MVELALDPLISLRERFVNRFRFNTYISEICVKLAKGGFTTGFRNKSIKSEMIHKTLSKADKRVQS